MIYTVGPLEILDQKGTQYCAAYAVAGVANFLLAKANKTARIDADNLYKRTITGTGFGLTVGQILAKAQNEGLPIRGAGSIKVASSRRISPYALPIKNELKNGVPLAFGYQVSNGIEFSRGIEAPDFKLKWPLLSHAMVLTGFDEENNTFRIANSYGTEWGDGGYFNIDMMYMKTPWLIDAYSFTLSI